ncbi:50S ribosomal protein L10 [Candidatus Micrarchaeota archaeon CG1_02_55_41]|nr:MAG: 50S ribosomal protein L10 [Candidatus Micrarchaeota archaeon CG1_02_55_41]
MAATRKQKEEFVAGVKADLQKYSVVAVASIESLPGKQYGKIKKKTRDHVKIDFGRQTLLKRAIEECGREDVKQLEGYFGNATVLVLSDLDAFKLYALFKRNKSRVAAKAGQVPANDLVVKAGETSLTPGPVLTDLKNAGLQAKIQGPKVVIMRDAVVVKAGEPVSKAAANVLGKLGEEPFEVGINVLAVLQDGKVFKGVDLDIDEEAFLAAIQDAYRKSVNLAVYAEIWNDVSAPLIVAKAALEAKAVKAIVDEKIGSQGEKVEPVKEAEPAPEGAKEEAPAEEKQEEPEGVKPTEEKVEANE